jgi:hypothetical protein
MRFLDWLLGKNIEWHKESLAYLKRSSRHTDSIDPNYWVEFMEHIDRSSAGNLKQHPAPWKPSTAWEKRNGQPQYTYRYSYRVPTSLLDHVNSTEEAFRFDYDTERHIYTAPARNPTSTELEWLRQHDELERMYYNPGGDCEDAQLAN